MLLFHEPSRSEIDNFIAAQTETSFTYKDVGATKGAVPSGGSNLPSGYVIDHHCVQLGSGIVTFERASQAIRSWKMFEFDWLQLCWPDTPMQIDKVVAVIANHFGLWSLNACRIVYVIDDHRDTDRFARVGLAYGTLVEHAESGEERFMVEFDRETQLVHYDILAFSRPNQFAAKLGYPIARALQKRFALDSMSAMQRNMT